MGSDLAKRDSLSIDMALPPTRKTIPQPVHKVTRKENLRDISEIKRQIEDRILEKSSTKDISLEKLVRDLSAELGCKQDKIIAGVIRLQTGSRILVRETVPYRRFMDYLLSPISMWFWELAVTTVVSLGLVFASSGLALYLRYVFGSLLVLFLPGYSLIGFIYFKKDDLDYLTRISVSFAMSLAITTMVGLVLNFTPFGITLLPVALSTAGVTIGLLFLTALRKYSYYSLANTMAVGLTSPQQMMVRSDE
jgi:hypothetical protein